MEENKKCIRCDKEINRTTDPKEAYWIVEEQGIDNIYCEQCHDEKFLPSKGKRVE